MNVRIFSPTYDLEVLMREYPPKTATVGVATPHQHSPEKIAFADLSYQNGVHCFDTCI
jgi:hypothetical protein